jgi:PAS domain S-box-containing protein
MTTKTIDISNCETEPIRFPGAVQPHGALLVLSACSGIIEAASDSCATLLGLSAESLLRQPLSNLVGYAVQSELLLGPLKGLQPLVPISLNGKALCSRSSSNESGQILVDIEAIAPDAEQVAGRIAKCRQDIATLRRLRDIGLIAQAAADLFRNVTEFDRVMIYRFDEDWNGAVVAESRIDGIDPYLGLNFPASDIPGQARTLFQSSKVRQIPDVRYVPSALICLGDGKAIDLGLSSLRSVSPIHIEYLENMEVRSTLVGSLVVEGRLWGLLSCQHKSAAKYFGTAEREALGWVCEDIAALLETTTIRQRWEREHSLSVRRRKLVDAIREFDFKTLMQLGGSTDLLEVVAADGFALVVEDSIQTTGITPGADRIRELQRRRHERAASPTLFSSHALSHDLELADAGDGVAGALFVSLRGKPETTMIWFRNERSYSVRWGGDPDHPHFADESGRMSPRKSFAQFLQDIRGRSLAWSPEELESAKELGSLIEIEALREREAFTQTILDSIPEHLCVLDSRGVIVTVNKAWRRFAEGNGAPELVSTSLGINYRSICVSAVDRPGGSEAGAAWNGIEGVLSKRLEHFTLDYPCDSPAERRWFRMSVYPMIAPCEGVVVAHENITDRKLAAEKLLQSEARVTGILEGAADAIFIMDRQGFYRYVNHEATRLLGYDRDQLLRMSLRDLTPAKDLARVLHQFATILARGSLRSEMQLKRSDGVQLAVELNATVLPDGSVFGSCRDITERNNTLAALHENEERFRLAFVHSPIGMVLCHLDGHVFKVNSAVCRMTGFDEEEIIGRRLSDLVLRGSAASVEIDLFHKIALGKIDHFAVTQDQVHKDGRIYIAQNSISVIRDNANTPLYCIAHLEDLTERQRRQLEALAKQTLKAQEDERLRISRELHDEIGQSLGALKLTLKRAQRKSKSDESRTVLREASEGADHMLEAVMSIAYRLRPSQLDDLGLMPSLRWHIDKVVRPTGLSCYLSGNLNDARLHSELEVCFFRVAQEALNNVVKHARATKVEVMLDRSEDAITLSVRDNGIGFDVSRYYVNTDYPHSLGLIGMRERVAALRGRLQVQSTPEDGAVIMATLPLL